MVKFLGTRMAQGILRFNVGSPGYTTARVAGVLARAGPLGPAVSDSVRAIHLSYQSVTQSRTKHRESTQEAQLSGANSLKPPPKFKFHTENSEMQDP